jgi:hypothetical protein
MKPVKVGSVAKIDIPNITNIGSGIGKFIDDIRRHIDMAGISYAYFNFRKRRKEKIEISIRTASTVTCPY